MYDLGSTLNQTAKVESQSDAKRTFLSFTATSLQEESEMHEETTFSIAKLCFDHGRSRTMFIGQEIFVAPILVVFEMLFWFDLLVVKTFESLKYDPLYP